MKKLILIPLLLLSGCAVYDPMYVQPRPIYVSPAPVYIQPRPVYIQPRPVYVVPPRRPYCYYETRHNRYNGSYHSVRTCR
jgi:hypothetical protein